MMMIKVLIAIRRPTCHIHLHILQAVATQLIVVTAAVTVIVDKVEKRKVGTQSVLTPQQFVVVFVLSLEIVEEVLGEHPLLVVGEVMVELPVLVVDEAMDVHIVLAVLYHLEDLLQKKAPEI